LEIVPEVAHDMSTFEDSLQKAVLVAQIIDVILFCLAKVFASSAANELVFKAVNSPTNVRWQGTVSHSVSRLSLPDKLSFILQQNVFVRSLYEIAFHSSMGQNRERSLRMAEGVG
jgi:hypothetical protein